MSVRPPLDPKTRSVDLLMHPRPGVSALARAGLIDDLESLLGRRVDVVADQGIHWLIRPQVLFETLDL